MECKFKTMTYSTIILDFDFTIANSSKGVEECIDYALKEMGFELPDRLAIHKTIGLSLEKSFSALTGSTDGSNQQEFKRLFIEKADEVMARNTFIFESAKEFIPSIKSNNIRLGIVSTKFRYRIKQILSRENLLHFFDIIIGGEDVAEHKPNPEGLLKSINLLNVKLKDAVYVGDSATDAETAYNAGVDFIAVTTGTTSKYDFADYKSIAIFDDLKQLETEFINSI